MRSHKKFYGYAVTPFRKDIAVTALLRYAQLDELTAYLTFVAEEGSIGLVTGDVGVGKSTALRAFLAPSTIAGTTSVMLATRMPRAACCASWPGRSACAPPTCRAT